MTVASGSLITVPDGSAIKADSERMRHASSRFGASLYRYLAVRTGGNRHLADDLLQQVWAQSAGHLGRLAEAEIEPYLRVVAKNVIRAHWRRTACRPAECPISDPAAARGLSDRLAREALPPEALEQREIRDALMLAITQLPSDDQTLILGRYFRERSNAELAASLGISERAVEGRLYRARQALRSALRDLDD